MNPNPIIAILVLKNIITQEEGQAVVDFVHDKPQSTILNDVINQIKELLPMQPLTGGPAQQEEELAARERLAAEEQAAESEGTDEDKSADSKQSKK